jgi:NADPH2:quinone reductase
MHAIRFHALGGPEVLSYEDVDDPTPGEGEVLVRVRAIGLNYADTMFRRGEYFVRPAFPQIPGMECAGEVIALGPGASGIAVGDRVMCLAANAYAEKLVCKPRDLFPMPDGLAFEQAAALPVQALTAHHVLHLCARVSKGERVLVHAGAGGVGTFAIQLAKRAGASMVIATVGSPEKMELVKSLGADVAINYREEAFHTRVREVTSGAGVDVILEMLGGTEAYKRNLASLAPLGRMVVFGSASGETRGAIEPIGLMAKNQSVIGYYLTPLLKRRELCAPPLDDVARLVASGDVRVVIGKQFPLRDAAEAQRALESRATVGKVVLTVS